MTPQIENRKSVSPIKKPQPLTIKPVVRRPVVNHKENNPNVVNQNNFNKTIQRKSVSPLKQNQGPTFKKVELRPSKSPVKGDTKLYREPSKPFKVSEQSRIQKLFKYLTKDNPSNLKILAPEYISIKGLDKNLLNDLQDFFEQL